MKICMVVPQSDVKGGIASVVNGYRENGLGKDCTISYVESYCDGSKMEKFVKAIKGYLLFAKEIIMNKPDIVHIHSSFGPSFYRKIPFIYMAIWRKIKIVNHIHGAEFDKLYTDTDIKKKKRVKKVYEKCDVLIALSEEWKEKLGKIVSKEKIVVIENYTLIPEFVNKERQNQILYLGELGKRKGCFDIPFIYQKAISEEAPVSLIMAGDGAKEEVKKAFQEQNVKSNVYFPGWVRGEKKENLLQESSIFLFPSYNEGMPMAILEAMSYGLAIITTNVGGIPKLIEDGVNGYLCEPGDINDLADKLKELIENPEKRSAFGREARTKVTENYSFDSHKNKILDLYNRLYKNNF